MSVINEHARSKTGARKNSVYLILEETKEIVLIVAILSFDMKQI